MSYKIDSITATIPVTGQSYTDLRPTVSATSIDEYRELLAAVGELAGNEQFVKRMRGQVESQNPLTASSSGLVREIGDGVLFNETDHTYFKNGKEYLSGSTFAHKFEKEFPRESIAGKVAARDGKEAEEVLEGWDAKGEISLQYGTLIHKCIETFNKFGELPNNEYLKSIVEDWAEVCDEAYLSEEFMQDDAHQLCGVIDLLGEHEIADLKTGDIHKKINHTLGKDFPNDALSLYTLQLNFYKYIAEQNGMKINKLTIYWLNGEHWEKVKVPIIDIKPYLEQVWTPKK